MVSSGNSSSQSRRRSRSLRQARAYCRVCPRSRSDQGEQVEHRRPNTIPRTRAAPGSFRGTSSAQIAGLRSTGCGWTVRAGPRNKAPSNQWWSGKPRLSVPNTNIWGMWQLYPANRSCLPAPLRLPHEVFAQAFIGRMPKLGSAHAESIAQGDGCFTKRSR